MTILKRIRTWARTQRLYRAYPELKAIDARIYEARRQHRPVRPLYRVKQQLILRALSGQG